MSDRRLCALLLFLPTLLMAQSRVASAIRPHHSLFDQEPGQPVAGPARSGSAEQIARAVLEERAPRLGLSMGDLAEMTVQDTLVSSDSQLAIVHLMQRHQGIPLHNARSVVSVLPDGRILSAYSNFYPHLDRSTSGEAVLAPRQALEAGLRALGLSVQEGHPVLEEGEAPERVTLLGEGRIAARPIEARLVYQPLQDGRIRLSWQILLERRDADHFHRLAIDAETGALLADDELLISERHEPLEPAAWKRFQPAPSPAPRIVGAAKRPARRSPDQYEVFEIPKEYPNDGPRTIVVDPADTLFSPFGWHDTNGVAGPEFTITRGNNVNAYADRNDDDSVDPGSQPDGTSSLNFTGALVPYDPSWDPNQYIPAAVTNLFYWNNIIHDVTARHGFDEASGNFQVTNYSGQGAGNDDVRAEAQDGADVGNNNNANFATPPDGSNPRMQMYIWTTATPNRDGDFSSMIVAHEYGHGVSNRLTGGPANTSCLGNNEQMGEGWSDFLGLVLTANASDTPTTLRGVGTWALNEPPDGPGIRDIPYTTDMGVNGWTYDTIKTTSGPHPLGAVWAAMLWDVYWVLVQEHGFNPDIYGDWTTGGNNLALRLVQDGMKLQPCSPGFVDGRDGILAADQALTGGANQCLIWGAFARRGLGYSADQGLSTSRTDGTEAFDIPPSCERLYIPDAQEHVCAGSDAVFTVSLGQGFTPPVTLSVAGLPGSVTAGFDVNPVPTVPLDVTLTLSNTAGLADGSYTVQVTGQDGAVSSTLDVELHVYSQGPGVPLQDSPADGALDTSRRPLLSWAEGSSSGGCGSLGDLQNKLPNWLSGETVLSLIDCLNEVSLRGGASATLSYTLEIDEDPGFSSPQTSLNVETTSSFPASPLAAVTTYYWRVRAHNPCGSSSWSTVRSFTTASVPTVLLVDDDDNSPDVRGIYEAALNAAGLAGFEVWNTNNSDTEPTAVDLANYQLVIWFTGDEYGGAAGPGTAGSTALAGFLDTGGSLLISSQDYYYDRGLTSLMTGYLGVSSITSDTGQTSATGTAGSLFQGLGPFTLSYPFSNFSDSMVPGNGGVAAFTGSSATVATQKVTGVYAAAYLGFPLEAIATEADRVAVLLAFLAGMP